MFRSFVAAYAHDRLVCSCPVVRSYALVKLCADCFVASVDRIWDFVVDVVISYSDRAVNVVVATDLERSETRDCVQLLHTYDSYIRHATVPVVQCVE